MKDEELNKLFRGNIIIPLKGFCTTVENNNNMTAAAKATYSTEATISRQVKCLESQLGVKLFEKKGKKLEITSDGKRLYRLGLPKLKSMQTLFMEFQNEKKNDQEKIINIAAHHVLLSHVLPKYIKDFKTQYPDINIGLYNINRNEALEKIKNHEIDFAIYPYDDVPLEFNSKILFEFEPYLMVNKNNSLAKKNERDIKIQDILTQNNLNIGANMTMPLIKDIISQQKIKTNITIINGSWEILKGLIKYDLGITGISSCYIDNNEKDLVYKNVSKILPSIQYKLVFLSKTHLNNFAKKFMQNLEQKI